MDSAPTFPRLALSTKYHAPLQQILHLLWLEPSGSRNQYVSRIEDTLRLLIQNLPSSDSSDPTPGDEQPPNSMVATRLLPPLYYPETPLRDLPTFSALPLLDPNPSSISTNRPSTSLPPSTTIPLEIDPPPSSSIALPSSSATSKRHASIPLPSVPETDLPSLPATNPPTKIPSDSSIIRPSKRRKTKGRPVSPEPTSPNPPSTFDDNLTFVDLTRNCDADTISRAAQAFTQQLHQLTLREKKNGVVTTSRLTQAEISLLRKFFFCGTFGEASQARSIDLLYELARQNPAYVSTSEVAAHKAEDSTILPEMQEFFSNYARWHLEEQKDTQVIPEKVKTIRGFELYKSFFDLREKAAGPEGGKLRDFLATEGFITSVGRDLRSCILKYLARELKIKKLQLSNTLQAYQTVFPLVQRYGKGILVLLPKGATHRMTRIGSQKMLQIIQILYSCLPQGAEVCEAAEYLIPYILQEASSSLPPVLGLQASSPRTLSLLDTFTFVRPAVISSNSPSSLAE